LCSFCENMDFHPNVGHDKCTVDHTHNCNLSRFNVLDHLMLTIVLFFITPLAGRLLYSIHVVDYISDHEPWHFNSF